MQRIEISFAEENVVLTLTFEQDATVPAALRDQVETREGTLTTDTADGVSRWLSRVPAVMLDPAVDLPIADEQERDLVGSRPS